MKPRTQPLFAPDQRANEGALQEEGKHSFHRQRLSDHSTGILREAGPVRSELKLHRNAGDDPDGEIETKDFGPEPGSLVVILIPRSQCAPFPIHQKPGQPHRELRKEIVISDREAELQSAPKSGIGEI